MPAPLMEIRPISDLRTKLNEIESVAKETKEPVVLTRNGSPSLVVMDADAYNEQAQLERHIRKLREAEIEAHYNPKTYTLEESKADMAKFIKELEAFHA